MIEAAILANMHRAIDKKNFDQLTRAQRLLEALKSNPDFIDYQEETTAPASFNSTTQDQLIYLRLENKVIFRGQVVELNRSENRLLSYMARFNNIASSNQLRANLWPNSETDAMVLKTICKLRSKIEPEVKNPRFLLTQRGQGYHLVGVEVIPPFEVSQ